MIGCMTTLAEISTTHWQPRLGAEGVVESIDDIHQCIRIILSTSLGEDPLRPDFGSDLARYLDLPFDRARPFLVREAVAAVQRWEPRVELIGVQCDNADVGRALLRVRWRLNGAALETEVAL